MMIFKERRDAGHRLAKALSEFEAKPQTIILALPRGGVVVGYEVAAALNLPLDIICPRKIGAPFSPELAIGAVTETGESILSDDLIKILGVSETYIRDAIVQEKEEAIRRLAYYRQKRPPRVLKGKTVILVDDGIATGSTMRAAIKMCRTEGVHRLVLAVPVAPPDTLKRIKQEVDQVICLLAPSSFQAVGQFYSHFDQTSDDEVIALLATNQSRQS